MRMTKMLDDIDLKEQSEIIQMTRYSTIDLDDEVFYTPGDGQEVKEVKPVEIEIYGKEITEQEQRAAQIIAMAKNWMPINRHDDYRAPDAANEGGFILDDPVVLAKFRSALRDLIGQVGRMLLSGKFELYKVSFPIKAMSPVSILKLLSTTSIHTPVYFTAAAYSQDPVQRMKLVMTQSISFIYPTHCFDKPLNPILGETYQGVLEDGSEICLEQVCHHPPISYICQYGPNDCYRWYGYTSLKPKASLNSISLNVEGSKTVEFPDGSKIWYTPTQDLF